MCRRSAHSMSYYRRADWERLADAERSALRSDFAAFPPSGGADTTESSGSNGWPRWWRPPFRPNRLKSSAHGSAMRLRTPISTSVAALARDDAASPRPWRGKRWRSSQPRPTIATFRSHPRWIRRCCCRSPKGPGRPSPKRSIRRCACSPRPGMATMQVAPARAIRRDLADSANGAPAQSACPDRAQLVAQAFAPLQAPELAPARAYVAQLRAAFGP